jgi:two-component system, NtrC family, sensor kinase
MPKSLLFLVLGLLAYGARAQSVRIDSLPQQGILLDKGWRWHAGDNPNFAKVDFDDSAWESIDPTQPILYLPQIQNTDIGWFRFRMNIDSSLSSEGLALLVWQMGASELFLNEKQFYQFGEINNDPLKVKSYQPFGKAIMLPIKRGGEQILAIRFAYPKNIPFAKYAGGSEQHNSTLQVWVCRVNTIQHNKPKKHDEISIYLSIFKSGIFAILMILHLAFYRYYPKLKANLFFGLYSFCLSLTFLLTLFYYTDANYLQFFYFSQMTLLFNTLAVLSFVEAIYWLFKEKRGWTYKIIVVLGVITLLVVISLFKWGVLTTTFFGFLGTLEAIRISIKAAYRQRRGVTIIGFGVCCYLVFFSFFLFYFSKLGFESDWIVFGRYISYNIGILSLPIAISLYLAKEFAFTSKDLEQQLEEVHQLSIEKQQILATQNETLERQVAERTAELQASQNQLIQSEKLASLGELTAGIAHEIQNPLNFVNNFSELSVDLVKDLKDEFKKSEKDDVYIGELFDDLSQNQEKISHHGKRASSIVKGMLEHSRMSTGVKEWTDINKLADEYLRLSYHGLRAKDKNFNSDFKTDFDENVPKIEVIPQDMGRVLLNLINNAFWVVKTVKKPLVTVKTEQTANHILIKVIDNGTGMSEAIKAKIFQPFFTTKPTGEGTGLGLSLAYDIITKGHGGTIECESKEREGTTFVVKLPIGSDT